MKVYLNGSEYVLQAGTGVIRSPLAEWADNIRLDGQQKRKDRRWLSTWAIDDWSNGLGIEWPNLDLASQQARLWNVDNCDTRNLSQIILAPLFNQCSLAPSRGDLGVMFTFQNNLYFQDSLTPPANTGFLNAFQFSPPFTIGSFRNVASVSSNRIAVAVRGIGGQLVVIGKEEGANELMDLYRVPTLGGVAVDVGNLLGGSLPRPVISDLGGTIHILTHSRVNEQVRFYLSDRAIGTANSVRTIDTIVGTYLSQLVNDGLTMYAQLPEGIYDFDETPNPIIDTSGARESNGAQVIFDQDLYFKNKKSLVRYKQDGSGLTNVGYDRDSGLPYEMFGDITAMTSSYKNTFAAVMGASYSHILSREQTGAWQYYAKIPSMGIWVREMLLTNSPDGIDRLWCLFGNSPNPGYFLNPVVNPLQAGTYAYVPTGFFDPPLHDGGMPDTPGGYYNQTHISDGIVGSLRITSLYGLNGAAPVSTLGVVATNTQTFTFGSPAGVEGYRIQPRYMLHSDTQGSTPIFRRAVINYLKIPPIREAYDFVIDVETTAKARTNPLEAVLGSLNSERNSRTLLPFWYGEIGTKNVRVIDAPVSEKLDMANIFEGERKGFISLRCVEML